MLRASKVSCSVQRTWEKEAARRKRGKAWKRNTGRLQLGTRSGICLRAAEGLS